MLKLVVLLISVAVLVNSCEYQKYLDSYCRDERTMYGWQVKMSSTSTLPSGNCYGIFIGPRVFLTHFDCVKDVEWRDMKITNDLFISDNIKTEHSVSYVYYEYERKLALLITYEPVIPTSETNVNSFVKLAEHIYDVDLTRCFIPELYHSPIIKKKTCQMVNQFINDDSIKDFFCTFSHDQPWNGNGLFCQTRTHPNDIVLAGYVGGEYIRKATEPNMSGSNYFINHDTIINLSGSNIILMNM